MNLRNTHSLLLVWRQEELEEIEKTTTGPERKAALCGLLEKEAELIAGIGQHRLSAGREAQEKAVERFLDAVSRIHSIYTRRGCIW